MIISRFVASIATLAALAGVAGVSAQTRVAAPMADVNGVIDLTPDSLAQARMARPVPGSTRRGDNPVLFLVGNSTMRTGTKGNGNNGQWGWGYFFPDYFDPSRISVENHALGGMSSRTFYERLWPEVVAGVRKGDWVIIELGHNDNGPYDSGRARASIPGIGRDSLRVTIQETGVEATVYSYGEYMRRMVRDVKRRGAHPILMSLTPRNAWTSPDSTRVERVDQTFGLWAKQVARQEKIPFVDLNDITARKFERFGRGKTSRMFYLDRIHTSEEGARLNAASAAEGLRSLRRLPLADYLLPQAVDTVTGSSRKGDRPVVFTIGDSTVKNQDSDPEGPWGWGSVLAPMLDTARISVENCAFPGRSARTFIQEGRWQRVYDALRPGDFVVIQFGHNDAGPIDTARERAELPGVGSESKVFRMASDGRYRVVHTYGEYLRRIIADTREKGAIPVVISHTPRHKFDAGIIESNARSFGSWTREVAGQTGAAMVDLNALVGAKLQRMADTEGLLRVNANFCGDHTHTSLAGAQLCALTFCEGLLLTECPLKDYVRLP